MLFCPWNHSVGPETPAPNVAVENHSLPSWEWLEIGPVDSPCVWLGASGVWNVQSTSPLATLKAIVSSKVVVAKAVPLTMIIAMPTPGPPYGPIIVDTDVGTSGNG